MRASLLLTAVVFALAACGRRQPAADSSLTRGTDTMPMPTTAAPMNMPAGSSAAAAAPGADSATTGSAATKTKTRRPARY